MDINWTIAFGGIATAIAVYSYIPYFIGIYKGTTKPHSFSWFLWGILTVIAFVIQILNDAGPGAWVTGFTMIACLFIAACGIRHFHENVRPIDWGCLIFSLLAIPIWLITDEPILAVLMITLIDYVGTYPTIRKSWVAPETEVAQTYFLSSVKFIFSIFAMSDINFVNSFYPAALIVLNFSVVFLLLYRRKIIRRHVSAIPNSPN